MPLPALRDSIERLTVRWRHNPADAHSLSTRMRIEQVLGMIDWRPPGMMPGEILVIRRLHQLPILSQTGGFSFEWEQTVRQRLAVLYRDAERPGQASIAPHALSIVFDDAARMLAMLTRDVLNQQIERRWYWRELLPQIDTRHESSAALLGTAWREYAAALPATFALLTTGEIYQAVEYLELHDIDAVLVALRQVFDLPAVQGASMLDADVESDMDADVTDVSSIGTLPPWASYWHEAPPVSLAPSGMYLIGLVTTLYRVPTTARSNRFGRQAARWLEVVERSSQAGPRENETLPATAVSQPVIGTDETQPQSSDESVPLASGEVFDNPHDEARQFDTWSKTDTSVASFHESAGHDAEQTAIFADDARHLAKPVIPDGLTTGLGGIFFLINVLEWLDLPHSVDVGLSGWGMIEVLARMLLGEVTHDDDALWPLLAQLDGRQPGAMIEGVTELDDFLLPAGWLRGDDSRRWRASVIDERVCLMDEAGFLVADVGLQDEATQTRIERLITIYRGQGIDCVWEYGDTDAPITQLPHLAHIVNPTIYFWLARVRGFFISMFEQLLGDPALASSWLLRDGQIVVSHTHIDIYFDLEFVDLAVRRVALDFDPGWCPDLGYIVLFHYVSDATE